MSFSIVFVLMNINEFLNICKVPLYIKYLPHPPRYKLIPLFTYLWIVARFQDTNPAKFESI